MGNWNITIRGIGPHHNGKDYDADNLAKVFVEVLKEKGQTVVGASITYGGENDLLVVVPAVETTWDIW